MSFLQKAREIARDAADATTKAAGSVAAKAQDPGTQEKVRSGISSAGQQAGVAAKGAAGATSRAAGAVAARAQDPATQAKVKSGIVAAGRGARTMVERIDPGILADVVIKATALQEKANARLRAKGSLYRISEIVVTATLPPGVSFTIARSDDREDGGTGPAHTSTEILAAEAAQEAAEEAAGEAGPPPEIVSLDTEEQAAIAGELAAVEASMDAAVEAIEAAEEAGAGPASEGGSAPETDA